MGVVHALGEVPHMCEASSRTLSSLTFGQFIPMN